MTDEIPEDANIFFCAFKKSGYLLRDIVVCAAEGAIFLAMWLMALMVILIHVQILSAHLKPIVDFVISLPIFVYPIIILAIGVYSYSLVWCHIRKIYSDYGKVCAKYGIDPNVFKILDRDHQRIYIYFDANEYPDTTSRVFRDGFVILRKNGIAVVGSIDINHFAEKIKYFEKNNISIIKVEFGVRIVFNHDGWV